MFLRDLLEGEHVVVHGVHPESKGYFGIGSFGVIDLIESDGAVYVRFFKGQASVKDEVFSHYVGDLNDCDQLFELLL